MRLTPPEAWIMILALGAGTALTRFLPFWLFPEKREIPPYVLYLGEVLPYAIIGLLVAYCLRGISFSASPFALPEILAVAFTVLLHLWRRSMLLSIAAGTVFYMLLTQLVFR